MHRKRHLYLIPSILFSLVLSSCQLLQISPTIGKKPDNSSIIPASNTSFSLKADGTNQPEMLTFPSLVPLQPMTPVQSLPKGKVYDVTLTTSTGKLQNDQIRIPANGKFKVSYQNGQHSRIIDNDASLDGLAVVEIPSGTYDALVGANVSDGSKLTIKDGLYYQNQEISPGSAPLIDLNGKKPSMQFHKIGPRQIPVPESWFSTEGSLFSLDFNNQGVSQGTIRWAPISNPVELPPGTKEIGPAGGTVELPGVGKVEIPEGALTEKRVISIKELLTGPELLNINLEDQEWHRSEDYISPLVKILPQDIQLNKEALIFLRTDLQRLGSNAPGIISWKHGKTFQDFGHIPVFSNNLPSQNWTVDMPTASDELGYFFKVIPSYIKPTDNFITETIDIPLDDNFDDGGLSVEDNLEDDVSVPENNLDSLEDSSKDSFRIQSSSGSCENSSNLRLRLITPSFMLSGKFNEIVKPQFNYAYQIYSRLFKVKPCFLSDGLTVVYLYGDSTATTQVVALSESQKRRNPGVFGEIKVVLHERDIPRDAVPHELWHVFQFSKFNYSDYVYHLNTGNAYWLIEGPATLAGAYIAKSPQIYNRYSGASRYVNVLAESQQSLWLSLLNRSSGRPSHKTTGFFTHLSHFSTGITQRILAKEREVTSGVYQDLRLIARISDKMNTTASNHNKDLAVSTLHSVLNEYMGTNKDNVAYYYQEFGLHALIKDRLNLISRTSPPILFKKDNVYPISPISQSNNSSNPVVTKPTYKLYGSDKSSCLSTIYNKIGQDNGPNINKDLKNRYLITKLKPVSPFTPDVKMYVVYHLRNGNLEYKSVSTLNNPTRALKVFADPKKDIDYLTLILVNGESNACNQVYTLEANTYYGYDIESSQPAIRVQDFGKRNISITVNDATPSQQLTAYIYHEKDQVFEDGSSYPRIAAVRKLDGVDLEKDSESSQVGYINTTNLQNELLPGKYKIQIGSTWLMDSSLEFGIASENENVATTELLSNFVPLEVIDDRVLVPVPSNCGFPCRGPITELNATMSWPTDPYPFSFPNRHSGSTLTLDSPDLYSPWSPVTGMDYAVTNMEYGQDADGNAIVTRLKLTFMVSGANNNNLEPFSRAVRASSISMVSTDGKKFMVEPNVSQPVGSMNYGYSYNGDLLSSYFDSRCNPSVSGSANTMTITGGDLTMHPPATGNFGSASFNITLSGSTQVTTNNAFYCYAAREIDGTTTHYGHKNVTYGNSTASASMKVGVWFEER